LPEIMSNIISEAYIYEKLIEWRRFWNFERRGLRDLVTWLLEWRYPRTLL